MITTHKLTCGCCGSPATATMDGETFKSAECEKGCTILSMPADVHAELVRRVRASEPPLTLGERLDAARTTLRQWPVDEVARERILLHVLRNPWGWSDDAVRWCRNRAADILEAKLGF